MNKAKISAPAELAKIHQGCSEPTQSVNPSEDDEFYVAWGRESVKNNLAFANEILRELVTLTSFTLGGSVAFLDEHVIEMSLKPPAVIAFLSALIFAFLGMMPYEGKVLLTSPSEIREHKEKALRHKRRFLWWTGGLLGIGFGLCIAGVLVKIY